MKNQRNKNYLYNHKPIKSIKINVHTVIEERHIKFSIIHKVSYALAKRFSQDPLET